MPASAARATDEPAAVAPDGIAIHVFGLAATSYVGVAEGRIPPGHHAIHRHLTLEQFTYVIDGELIATTGSEAESEPSSTRLRAGDLLLTLPGESLQFANPGPRTARVLFICGPPYPADDADTRLTARHGRQTASEAGQAVERLELLRTRFNATIDARVSAIRRNHLD
jgi:uncharacterized cupin superfamily protein